MHTHDPGLEHLAGRKHGTANWGMEFTLALELAIFPWLSGPPLDEEEHWVWSSLPLLVVPMQEDKPVTPRSFERSLMFRVLCSSEPRLSKLLFFEGTLGLGLRLVAETDTLVLPLVSCWMNQEVGVGTEACFPSALPLPCAWHSSLFQSPAAVGNKADLLPLILGLVSHPQKAHARTDQTQIAVKVAPGWTAPVLGSPRAASVLRVPSPELWGTRAVPHARSMLPSLGERWWEKHRSRSSAVFIPFVVDMELFRYCPSQNECFFGFVVSS